MIYFFQARWGTLCFRSALLTLLLCAGCSSGAADDTGLTCKDGKFYLDGKEFNDCDQCSDSASCSFEDDATYSYDATGARHVTSEVVTAHCAGESATLVDGACK
jgi:hypothetical protein